MLSIVSALGMNAQTDDQYDAALAAITDGAKYSIVAEYNGGTYYLKTNGYLTDNLADAGVFTFTAATIDGGFKATGFKSGKFTNGGDKNNNFSGDNLKRIATNNSNRDDWEAQVYFLNDAGYYAIRSTNAVSANWGASAYWTVVDDNDGDLLPNATYTVSDVPFLWKLQDGALVDVAKAGVRYTTVKDAAKTIIPSLDTTSPDAAFSSATSIGDVNSAIASLRAAFVAALPGVEIPGDPGYIDVTAVMVDNAGVHTSTEYWTIANLSESSGSAGVCNYGECEFYNRNFKFYQTLTLGTGTWEFGVTGFHRAGNHTTYFYAGSDKILIPGVESSVVNNMAQAKTYFDEGNGKVALKFGLEAEEDKTIEIGIDNKDTQTDKWTIFRDFTLKYYGSAVDYTAYQARWNEAVTAATEAMADAQNINVTGKELTDLNTALANAPTGSSKKADYNDKTLALTQAVNAYKAAAPSYNAYATYKKETVALWGSDLGVTAPTTADEAVAAVATLNIAQYNKVASNYTFSLNGLIGDFGSWTGTATVNGNSASPRYLDYEHWSGKTHAYYEQAEAGWGSNAWTIKYEKTCKLPKGKYVLKVAARSSSETMSKVTCSATGTVISLPSVGATGRGINIDGEASWSDNDTFFKANEGFGWQWRFLPFEVTGDGKTEVTMTFEAEANTNHQWMSISDGELLCTEDVTDKVNFDERKNNNVKDNDIANVTILRTINKGYNTIVLPFTLGANQVTNVFGAGVEVYNYSENSSDPEKVTVNFKKGDGSITANVPVLIKAPEGKTSLVFKGVKVEAPKGAIQVEGKNIDFVGSYKKIAPIPEGNYFINSGKLYKSEGNTNMQSFRAYLKPKADTDSRVELYIDGIATGIETIDADMPKSSDNAIYNLNGQRVQKAQRGLYIMNGKKVLVK